MMAKIKVKKAWLCRSYPSPGSGIYVVGGSEFEALDPREVMPHLFGGPSTDFVVGEYYFKFRGQVFSISPHAADLELAPGEEMVKYSNFEPWVGGGGEQRK